ncbi:MAG: NAD(P)-dependent oxidoreductase [Hyphomicrobiales bacterium]|nr:MAG: NAD(P)-dependent oxidoreductase [Hyphomicrobiales bacterium]
MTKIAVTGASGFVGRHVLRALSIGASASVTAVSRGQGGDWLPEGMRHVRMDLSDSATAVYETLGRPDVLIHLAWGGLPHYDSRHHFETELPTNYGFLKAMVEQGLPSMLCVGTCFEYGMRDGKLDESLPPSPHNAYAFAKDSLRRQLSFLREASSFRFTWARLFYMYGEGQSKASLYGQFNASLERGDTRFPMSGGEQLRDYMPVEKVAEKIVALALRTPDAGIVNVCEGKPTSVRALVEGWARGRKWAGELALGQYPYPTHEPMAFWGCNAKLNRLIGEAA